MSSTAFFIVTGTTLVAISAYARFIQKKNTPYILLAGVILQAIGFGVFNGFLKEEVFCGIIK